jgi:hypothetical protein
MFRSFVLMTPKHDPSEYLGAVKLLNWSLAGIQPSDDPFLVKSLKYKSARKGFRTCTVVVEGNHQLPVGREQGQWEWATEPPPGWKTGHGIPYDLEEAMRLRDGRPYGFGLQGWEHIKANVLRHGSPRSKFPQDYYIDLEAVKQQKEEQKQKKKQRKSARERQKPAKIR